MRISFAVGGETLPGEALAIGTRGCRLLAGEAVGPTETGCTLPSLFSLPSGVGGTARIWTGVFCLVMPAESVKLYSDSTCMRQFRFNTEMTMPVGLHILGKMHRE